MQTEVRRLTSNFGDRAFNFDPNVFNPLFQRNVDQNTARVGVRFSPFPTSDVIGSVIYNDRDVNTVQSTSGRDIRGKGTSIQGEGEYLFNGDWFNVVTGLSISQFDLDTRVSRPHYQHRILI